MHILFIPSLLHGQKLAVLEALQHLLDGALVQGGWAHVAWSGVAHRLGHGSHGGA